MKIEMGESLFYSWLRHVKECQVVQLNWKSSPSWQIQNEESLEKFMNAAGKHFLDKYGYGIFKKNSLSQLLQQAEVDALGINTSDNVMEVYAVDVAFHGSGLNYGAKKETVMRVVKKLVRTALCIISYFCNAKSEIIFSAPKIHNAVLNDLKPCIDDLNILFLESGYDFTARVIANEDFNEKVLNPIIVVSNDVSDTSELFMRSYQLVNMFGGERRQISKQEEKLPGSKVISTDALSELKVGKIVQTLLRDVLQQNKAGDEEVRLMQTKDYSKNVFGIDFPLLVSVNEEFDSKRYYTFPVTIGDKQYRLCSQWFEVPANNDRPFLLAWLEKHICLDSPQHNT
jgi:hypothetical protein